MLWLAILVVPLVVLMWTVIWDRNGPIDQLPGPKKFPIVGNMFQFMVCNPYDFYKLRTSFGKLYGDRCLVKIMGRRVVHICNPRDVEAVLSHTKNITKSKLYVLLRPWLGTGILLSTGSEWHKRRKILTPAFHFNILKHFSTIIEEKSLNLVQELKNTEGQEQSLYPLMSDVTLYSICETAMGVRLDKNESAVTMEYKQAIIQIGELVISRLLRVWLHSDIVFRYSPLGKLLKKVTNQVYSFTDNVIREKKRQRSKVDAPSETENSVGRKTKLAFLDLLLEAESRGEIDLDEIRDEVNTFMFGGYDTTATALTFILMLIADHEEVEDRIFEEIQNVVGDRLPNMSDLAELKYLEAVIKESLRLYPSVPFIGRKITEGFMMGDLFIPKNTEIKIQIYDLHRRADQFPDPESFKPERFLYGGGQWHPYAYIPFSAGSRNCIGQKFAMLELKSILCHVCRNFKLHPKVKGWRPDLYSDLTLRLSEPIYIKFISRK